MQAFYDNKPDTFEAVGNGSYLYRYDIKEVEAPATQEGEEARTQYSCQEVVVWSPVDANKVTQAVIEDRWDRDYEQKLVNEYNSATLGLYDEETAAAKTEAYKALLKERAALKAQVNNDFKTFNP